MRMEDKRDGRNSSVELVKIFAIVTIVIAHSMPDQSPIKNVAAINIGTATTDMSLFIASLLHNLGQVGNDIFIISASWFLVDSNKISLKKVAHMIGDCFFISVACCLTFIMCGYNLSIGIIVKQFIPVTMGNYWFVTCYLLFYIVHPLLNKVLNNIEKQTLLRMDIIFVILYAVIGFICKTELFYYNNLIGFIGIYFCVAYCKKYLQTTLFKNRKVCFFLFGIGLMGHLMLMIITNILGLKINYFSHKLQQWHTIINPFFILMAFAIVILSLHYNFSSKIINYISSLSLHIYMIHTNRLVRDKLRFDIFEYIAKRSPNYNLILVILIYSVVT